jgi:Uma2 family endonuclease
MAITQGRLTKTEYFRQESQSDRRHEFIGGVVREMAGASRSHLEITRNLHGILYRELSGGQCVNFDQDIKVYVASLESYFYPDATISCPPNFIDEINGVIDNPTAIFEVLSPSTSGYDLGPKFKCYQALESLCDYISIDSERQQVDIFSRHQSKWVLKSVNRGAFTVPSVGIEVSLAELYRFVSPGRVVGA